MTLKNILVYLILGLLLTGFVSSCSGIKMLSGDKSQVYYSSAFLERIDTIKAKYSAGNAEQALKELKQMDVSKLNDAEKASRRNLIGVIYFGEENYEQSIFNFNQALESSQEDPSLTAQVYLNLASSYYKLGMKEKAYEVIQLGQHSNLEGAEFQKYHKLRYRLAKENSNEKDELNSLVFVLSEKKELSSLRIDPMYEVLVTRFRELKQNEKYELLESFEETTPLVVGYLAYLEAEKVYYSGEKEDANDLISWTEANFSEYEDIKSLLKNFSFRAESFSKLEPRTIGVILPLSGDKADYGKRALLGVDAALRHYQKLNPELGEFNIVVKDSKASGVVGSHQVRELIEKDFASVIIGGLMPAEATKEFEAAKRRGVFFISLYQVYMDKEQKDHLLLEVQGSVESQVSQLFSDKVLKNFGKRGAIIYPDSTKGHAFVNEFWRKAKLKGIDVSGIFSYDKSAADLRDPVKNLLSLKYKRTRNEEFDILNEVYSLEKTRGARRIQTLKPMTDFDWVFVPSYPKEAIRLIPSFTYYDAFNVPIIGESSWRSRHLSEESYKYKNINFIGDDVQEVSKDLMKSFQTTYSKNLGLIELWAFDSMSIAMKVIQNNSFTTREELDVTIRSLDKLSGHTGAWMLDEGIWIKKMANLNFRNGKIKELEEVAINTELETKEQLDEAKE